MSELERLRQLRSVLEGTIDTSEDLRRQFQTQADAMKKQRERAERDLRRVNAAIKKEERR
jgi:hypothetical protein